MSEKQEGKSAPDLNRRRFIGALGAAAAAGAFLEASNSSDIVYYLKNREAIVDAIYQYPNVYLQQRRISNIPLHTPLGGSED
jgi:hypothetical protein